MPDKQEGKLGPGAKKLTNPQLAILFIVIILIAFFLIATFYSAQSKVTYSAVFNGKNSSILVPDSAKLDPSTSITVLAWIYPSGNLSSNGSANNWPTIVSKTNSGYTLQGCQPGEGNPTYITFWINNNGDGNSCALAGTAVYYGRWYLIAITYNGSVASQYENGTLVYTQPFSTNINATGYELGIGTQPPWNGGVFKNRWNGSIADVQIYSTALSAQQIKQLYSEGLGGVPITQSGLVGWWPLNGTADDYSGNGENGQTTGITYTKS